MDKDNLITCPNCGGNACYENKITEDITTKHCFGCGFCTNSLMKNGEEGGFLINKRQFYLNYIKIYYLRMKKGLTWMPASINKPMKGYGIC